MCLCPMLQVLRAPAPSAIPLVEQFGDSHRSQLVVSFGFSTHPLFGVPDRRVA
jgi:hypothetical protein